MLIGNKHKKNCQVLREFNQFWAKENEQKVVVKQPTEQANIFDSFFQQTKKAPDNALENILSFDEYEGIICCCKHHIPHDECLKFKIIASAENMQISPFKNKP